MNCDLILLHTELDQNLTYRIWQCRVCRIYIKNYDEAGLRSMDYYDEAGLRSTD